MEGNLRMKKYYFTGGMLLAINIAIFIFFQKFGSSTGEGWHAAIYPISFLLVRVFALSILLAFSCWMICLLLKNTKPLIVSALYFILVSIALLLLAIPFLPYKIIGVQKIDPGIVATIELIASAAFYAIIFIHLLLILYFVFPNQKRVSAK